jgi:hypothetical protein
VVKGRGSDDEGQLVHGEIRLDVAKKLCKGDNHPAKCVVSKSIKSTLILSYTDTLSLTRTAVEDRLK